GSLVAAALLAWACSAGDSLDTSGLLPPDTVTATTLNLSTVRVEWTRPAATDLQLFRIERRRDFTGGFRLLAEVDASTTSYFDTGLDPGTFYGYRVLTVDRVGESSRPSTVAGALTPPPPGLVLETSLRVTPPG